MIDFLLVCFLVWQFRQLPVVFTQTFFCILISGFLVQRITNYRTWRPRVFTTCCWVQVNILGKGKKVFLVGSDYYLLLLSQNSFYSHHTESKNCLWYNYYNALILCGNIIVNAYTYFYLKDIVYSFKIYPGENFLVLICNPRSCIGQLDGAGLLNWIESNRKWLVSAWPDVQYPMSSKESFSSLICSLAFLPLDQYHLNGTSVLKIPLSCRFCFYTFNNITGFSLRHSASDAWVCFLMQMAYYIQHYLSLVTWFRALTACLIMDFAKYIYVQMYDRSCFKNNQ